MPELILKVVLPLIGLIIILVCIGAYFFKYGANLKGSIQEIKMFGADMKISIITVFVLVGLIFVFSGTYFTIVNTNSKLTQIIEDEKKKSSDYQQQMLQLKGQIIQLQHSQNKDINYYLDLEGDQSPLNPQNLKIFYTLFGEEDMVKPLNGLINTTNEQQRLMITIPDIKPGSFIRSLVVEDMATRKKWKATSFFPLAPELKLTHVN
jgi:hypothetical protein